MTRSRRAVTAVGVYLVIILVASLIAFGGQGTGEGAIWLTILGLPWSLFLTVIGDLISSGLVDKSGPIIGLISALTNCGLMYWWLKRERRRSERRDGTEA